MSVYNVLLLYVFMYIMNIFEEFKVMFVNIHIMLRFGETYGVDIY